MGLEIYNLVVEVIGELPMELNFVYAICTVLVILFLLMVVAFPFILIYRSVN